MADLSEKQVRWMYYVAAYIGMRPDDLDSAPYIKDLLVRVIRSERPYPATIMLRLLGIEPKH